MIETEGERSLRVAIIGSRGLTAYGLVEEAMAHAQATGLRVGLVLSGGAHGVDRLGEAWARAHEVPMLLFTPAWEQYGRRAGIVRNVALIGQAEAVVAIHTGTPGTRHALSVARKRRLPIWEFCPGPDGLSCVAQPPQEKAIP